MSATPDSRDMGINSGTLAGKGVFITFEGGEGSGKSTHIRFLAKALEERGYEVVCLREPGATSIGEALRDVILDVKNDAMDAKTELLLYEAARAQLVAEVIQPALSRGAVVLCDRFFDSTVAYQGYGRGLDRSYIERINEFACEGVVPDRTILLECVAGDGLKRAVHHGPPDRLESAGIDFHHRVNEGFRSIAAGNPERVRLIESNDAKSVTSALIFHQLADIFPWMNDASVYNEDFFAPLDEKSSCETKHTVDKSEYRDDAFSFALPKTCRTPFSKSTIS